MTRTTDDALEPIFPGHWTQLLHNRYWGKSLNIVDGRQGDCSYRYVDLDVNIRVLHHSERFIILSQYDYFFQRIIAIKEFAEDGVVLLGNPGIGKTAFLIFMLLNCLVNKERVVLALRGTIFVVNSNGVFTIRSRTHLGVYFDHPAYRGVLALVDSDERSNEPDPGLVHSELFAVHATWPQPSHYRNWVKQRRAITLVMDPLTVDDMHALVSLERPEHVREEVEAAMLRYGTDSRTILQVFTFFDGATIQEMEIQTSLRCLSWSQLENLIWRPADKDYTLIQCSRSKPSPQRGDRRYLAQDMIAHSIASPYIWKLLYKHFMESSLQEIRRLFVSLAGFISAPDMRSWIFEAWCHDRICQADLALTLTEMMEDSSNLVVGQNTRTLSLGQKRGFEIYPSFFRYADTEDSSKYYVPREHNSTFHSFLRFSGEVGVGFWMTVSSRHTLKTLDLRLLEKRLDVEERLFVFVVPAGHTFQCEVPAHYRMNKFKFYILEVDFGHFVDQVKVAPGLHLETPSNADSGLDLDLDSDLDTEE
ncbi:unnamed protein product [Cyclocybe aegerita]|uniref:Uncharacterized protein n=1 Tax=Cyclocybe aegerita TaxID=1973307 RepID=A0A8S0XHF2_CYCAE|nr:unnamed protein product [Cyclocybe aegerita]